MDFLRQVTPIIPIINNNNITDTNKFKICF